MTGRNILLDMVRGMAILIVVLGHAITASNSYNHSIPLTACIRTFQMPLLMAVSGYAAGLGRRRPLLEVVKRRTVRLLIPYFSWVWVMMLLHGGGVQQFYLSQFWFLRVLFIIAIIIGVSESLCAKVGDVKLQVLVVALFIFVLYVIHYLPGQGAVWRLSWHYVIGFLLARLFSARHEVALKARWICCFLGFVFLLLSYITWGSQPLPYTGVLMAVSGSCFIVSVGFVVMYWSRMSAVLSRIGMATLSIYAIHWCLFFAESRFPWDFLVQNGCNRWISTIVVYAVWLMGVWLINWILSRNRYIRFIFLGT